MKIKLPFTKALYSLIARKEVTRKIDMPNKVLEVGLFDTVTESLPQIDFLNGFKTVKPSLGKVNSAGEPDVGHGAEHFPDSKDFYMGEVL